MKSSTPTMAGGMTSSSIAHAEGMGTPLAPASVGAHALPIGPHMPQVSNAGKAAAPKFTQINALPHMIHPSRTS